VSVSVVWLTFFVLSVFVGIEVISKVSSTLHTPLMSGANAIHGIILLGAVLVTGATTSTVWLVVGLVAIVLAAVNMVGGFVVTDRMLQMFVRKRKPPTKEAPPPATSSAAPTRGAPAPADRPTGSGGAA
jgi:H+-translocating NAD(P) transhydrogenase subunit alpha